jgi:hypothetical protein
MNIVPMAGGFTLSSALYFEVQSSISEWEMESIGTRKILGSHGSKKDANNLLMG